MTTTGESSKASGQGSGARAITRGEEARVADALHAVLNGGGYHLQWEGDRLKAIHCFHWSATSVEKMAARAGIVPGVDGWCWAAPSVVAPHDFDPLCEACKGETIHGEPTPEAIAHLLSVDVESVRRAWKRGDKQDQALMARAGVSASAWGWRWFHAAERASAPDAGAPPAWITAAVLAALPVDGTPRSLAALLALGMGAHGWTANAAEIETVAAALVASGEIEMGPESEGRSWRRWGVPEGWAWGPMATDHEQTEVLYPIESDDDDVHVARATVRGQWWAALDDSWDALAGQGCATPATLAAAKCAAVRRLWERGVFAPAAAAPTPAPSPPVADPTAPRPARLRAALLAVLTRGPVLTTAALLPALDAAMGERAGVAVATGAEAMRAAREIGARVDGVEWSLPAVPDGWVWRPWQGDGLFLAPLDASNVADASIAMAAPEWWEMYKPGPGGEVIEQAPCASVEGGQVAALTAARLAGLFAAPRVEVAAPVAPAPVEAPTAPLDALARILTGETAPTTADATAVLAAFRADVVDAARAAVEAMPALRALMARRTLDASGVLRVYGEDGATVVHEERVGEPSAGHLLAVHRAALDAYAAHRRARSAPLDSEELSDAEAAVARTTGALFDLLDGAPAQPCPACATAERDAQAWQERAEKAERERDAARAAHRDQSHKAADAERSLGFARRDLEVARAALAAAQRERDEALATVERVRKRLDPVLAAIAGGRSGAVSK